MKKLTQKDLQEFQTAIEKDYGIKLEEKDLYSAAFSLLSFFDELTKSRKEIQVLKSSKQPH